MAKDIQANIPAIWERGGRVAILRMLTAIRKPCFGTVATLTQPDNFMSEAFTKGYHQVCDFLIVYRGDGSVFMSVNQGQSWFVLFDSNAASVLTGTLAWYGGSFGSLPSTWLYCDGSAVSRATYADLFTAIGTAYGVGDGSTTFNLPDLRGRHVVGGNDTESGTNGSFSTRSRGNTGGIESHQIVTSELPAHVHINQVSSATDPCTPLAAILTGRGAAAALGSAGGDGSHATLQPFIALYPIIKT